MLEKWIDKHLEKHGFIRVPKSWSGDYQEVVEKNRVFMKTMREMGREYNKLLEDYASHQTKRALKEDLTQLGVEFGPGDDLVNLYVETYAINFEDDTDEEVK